MPRGVEFAEIRPSPEPELDRLSAPPTTVGILTASAVGF